MICDRQMDDDNNECLQIIAQTEIERVFLNRVFGVEVDGKNTLKVRRGLWSNNSFSEELGGWYYLIRKEQP